MEGLTVFAIIIIIVFFALILYLISNKNNNNNYQKPQDNKYKNFNQISNDHLIKEKEEDLLLKENIPGYTNELMYENNLKDGDYVNQFKEIDFSMIPKSNNQIGFNPEPRDSSQIKLPYANINVNCL
jgi:predicted RND superfamily exporter protein